MKKTHEVLGLPIISISDGVEVGKVKSILINAEKGAIDYIVVDSGIQILSARVIPTGSILGIGEYALTIENDSAINDIGKIPAAIDLLQKNIQVKGAKVLTRKGRLVGEIGDFYLDENDACKITGLEYVADITHKRVRIIPRESVITFGKNLIVVSDDVENTLIDQLTQLGTGERPSDSEKKNLVISEPAKSQTFSVNTNNLLVGEIVGKADNIIAREGDDYFKEAEFEIEVKQLVNKSTQPEVEVVEKDSDEANKNLLNGSDQSVREEAPNDRGLFRQDGSVGKESSQGGSVTKSNARNLFEQRQKQYLNGRKATKTVVDSAGKVIIKDGDLINEEIIETAKHNGKLIELVMNNKA